MCICPACKALGHHFVWCTSFIAASWGLGCRRTSMHNTFGKGGSSRISRVMSETDEDEFSFHMNVEFWKNDPCKSQLHFATFDSDRPPWQVSCPPAVYKTESRKALEKSEERKPVTFLISEASCAHVLRSLWALRCLQAFDERKKQKINSWKKTLIDSSNSSLVLLGAPSARIREKELWQCVMFEVKNVEAKWTVEIHSESFLQIVLRGSDLLSDRAPRLVFLACIARTKSRLVSNVPRLRIRACTRPLSRLWTIAVAAKEAAKPTQPTLPVLVAAVSWLSSYGCCEEGLNGPKQTGAWRWVKAGQGFVKSSPQQKHVACFIPLVSWKKHLVCWPEHQITRE